MHLDSLRSIRYHFTALRFIFARARSRSAPNADQAFSTRRWSVDWTVGVGVGWSAEGTGWKKRWNRCIYERPVRSWLFENRGNPGGRDSPNGRTTRHVPLVASRAIVVQIARGTFIHFTLIAKYGAPDGECAKEIGKRRSEFVRELKTDGQISTRSSLRFLTVMMVQFNDDLVIVQQLT